MSQQYPLLQQSVVSGDASNSSAAGAAPVGLLLACRKHARVLQFRSAAKQARRHLHSSEEAAGGAGNTAAQQAALYCKRCDAPAAHTLRSSGVLVAKASEAELICYNLLDNWFPELDYQVEHTVVVGGVRRRVDVFVPSVRMAIQVDGKQHFLPSHKPSHEAVFEMEQQIQNDVAFNQAVREGDGSVVAVLVRLHHLDGKQAWGAAVRAGLQAFALGALPSITFTPSYK